jgi:mannitol/fructose-specific phosphotransferase system IIA component (Ntr-type)
LAEVIEDEAIIQKLTVTDDPQEIYDQFKNA